MVAIMGDGLLNSLADLRLDSSLDAKGIARGDWLLHHFS